MLNIVTVIAARGGSKSVPKKNIKDLCGQPLISYPILASLRTPEIDETYVSTDDKEIATIAEQYGAEVPFLRPAEFARDDSPDMEWVLHFLAWFHASKKYFPEYIVHLRATTPMVEPEKISEAIKLMQQHPECTSLLSMEAYTESPYKSFVIKDKYAVPLFNDDYHWMPKQACPTVYHPNGYVDVLKVNTLLHDSFHGKVILPFVTERVIEIDSEFEFELLRRMYENA